MESNPEILKRAIYGLPSYDPDPSVWEMLETDIFPFPVHHKNLHEPKAKLWSEIENSLKAHPSNKPSKFLYSIATILIVGMIGLIGYWYSSNPRYPLKAKDEIQVSETTKKSKSAKATNNSPGISSGENQAKSHEGEPVIIPEPGPDNYKNQDALEIAASGTSDSNPIYGINDIDETVSLFPKEDQSIFRMKEKTSDLILPSNHHQINKIPGDIECSPFRGSSSRFSIGILIGLDEIPSNQVNTKTSISYWSSYRAEFGIKRKRISFSLGVGTVYSVDKIQQEYTYLKNELIHSYTIVDSAYYNPETGTMEFITTKVDVYDSIEYTANADTKISYRYIQIPFGIGYQIVKSRYFSLYLYGNITYLQIASKKENPPYYNLENSRLIGNTTTFSKRDKSLYKLSFRPVIEYNISRRLTFSVAPNISYFTRPIHLHNKNNYSWGFDAGLHFNF